MVDGAHVINKCPAAAKAKAPEEAKRKRVEAAPLFLKGRVELDEALPEVDVRREAESKRDRASTDVGVGDDDEVGEAEACEQEVLRAVVGFVVKDLKAELVVELLQAIKPVQAIKP